MADLSDRIEEVASQPASASSDAGAVTNQDISKLIEADRYLKQTTAASKKGRGLRITKLIPPGTQGGSPTC